MQCELPFSLDPFGFKLVFITAKALFPLPSSLSSKSNPADMSSASPGETALLLKPCQVAELGFPVQHSRALSQLLQAGYASSAIMRGHLKGDLMVAGKGTCPSSPAGKCQRHWVLGTQEVSCSCKDDRLHSQETKSLIFLQCL